MEPVKKGRGRPKGAKNKVAVDLSIEESKVQAESRWRKEEELVQSKNQVIDKWYELRGQKLILCKRKGLGSVLRVYQGKLKDVRVKEFVQKLRASGDLKEIGAV